MSYNRVETSLALQYLRAPLNLQTNDHHERRLNEIRLKYRTYYVEYNVYDGAVMLPRLLIDDFVDQICRFSYLVDANENQFEVLVERIGRNFYFTRGWTAVRDFYDIRAGAWLLLMYIGTTHFGLMVEDRLHELIAPPIFNPPIRFNLHKSNITPYFVNNVPQSTMLAYSHAQTFFNVSHEKTLTYYDITSGFLMLPYDGFGEQVFGQQTTSIKLVDDCCNEWDCFLIHVTFPFKYFNVGGEWSSLVAGRRLKVGDSVKFGVEGYGHNDVVYLTLSP